MGKILLQQDSLRQGQELRLLALLELALEHWLGVESWELHLDERNFLH